MERLLAADPAAGQLLLVDKLTGLAKPLAPLWPGSITGLAYDEETELLYAVDYYSRLLVTVDPAQGWLTTPVGNTEVVDPMAAAIDPSDGVLYVLGKSHSGSYESALYVVDKTTAATALVGPIGFHCVEGLDFDPSSGLLYGARAGYFDNGRLLTIDTATGEGTLVAATLKFSAISFDQLGVLYGVHNGGEGSRLHLVDKATGAATEVGYMGYDAVFGLVFDSTFLTPVESVSWARVKWLFGGSAADAHDSALSN
jgi:hypothetical protein